jgi:DnaK suppressor protein
MTRKQLNFYKTLLQTQRAEILHAFAQEHRDYREMAEAPADLLDRATLDGSREFAAFLQHGDNRKWFEINAALARIESGQYGRCEECGEPINEARLKAMPTAALCLNCQRNFEKRQREYEFQAVRIPDEKWEEHYWGD